MAAAEDNFGQEGVRVEFRIMPGHREAIAALAAGEIDVYPFGAFYAMEAIAKGEDIYIFAGTTWEGTEFMSRPESPDIHHFEDLRSARLASGSTEIGCQALMDELARVGLAGEVTLTYVADDQEGIAGLREGRFDYYLLNNAAGYFADSLGLKIAGTVDSIVPRFACCTMQCSPQAYTQKHEALVKFTGAVLRGFADYHEQPEFTATAVADFSGQDPDFVTASLYGTSKYRSVMRFDPELDTALLLSTYSELLNAGLIEGVGILDGHLDTEILAAAKSRN
jgi:ABC-type nitrate/sulfonate/bicarbonate transport system substrate-binding protein